MTTELCNNNNITQLTITIMTTELCNNNNITQLTITIMTTELCNNNNITQFTITIMTTELCNNNNITRFTITIMTTELCNNNNITQFTITIMTTELCNNNNIAQFTIRNRLELLNLFIVSIYIVRQFVLFFILSNNNFSPVIVYSSCRTLNCSKKHWHSNCRLPVDGGEGTPRPVLLTAAKKSGVPD